MSNKVDIKKMFSYLDQDMNLKLSKKTELISHPPSKGDEVEFDWIGLLDSYLPHRYKVDKGFIVDHEGNCSDQIDIIIYDRHFTPFIFNESNLFIPAEGVYAVLEVKPEFNQKYLDYAVGKFNSVKQLQRTSANFRDITGDKKKDINDCCIIGGLLSTRMGSKSLFDSLDETNMDLDLVLSLEHGVKIINKVKNKDNYEFKLEQQTTNNPILAYTILKLIERLRTFGSVPALDVDAYLKCLSC